MMIDGFLVAVTVFSLVLAIVMSIMTWRVSQADRRRPELAVGPPEPATWPPTRRISSRSNEQSRPSALAREPVAAREQVNSDPRVASRQPAQVGKPSWSDFVIERTVLPAAPAPTAVRPAPTAARPAPGPRARAAKPIQAVRVPAARPVAEVSRQEEARIETPAAAPGNFQKLAVATGIGALLVVIGMGSALLFSASPSVADTSSPAAAKVALPLELVALDCVGDGASLSIRGSVRNPAAGTEMQRLEAVVFLYDARGVYLGTSHAQVADASLRPGSESSFEIPLGASVQVRQYKVSFRMAKSPVPHVDVRLASKPLPPSPKRSGESDRTAQALVS